MKLVTRILLSYALLLSLSAGGALLAFVGVHRASAELERAELAHRLHSRYLALSNHAYQLFKQFGDAILIGDRDLGRGETNLLELLESDLRLIARDIAREIDLVGAAEIEELTRLNELQRQLYGLIAEHHAILDLRTGGTPIADLSARLVRLHDESIDRVFDRLIREAIAEEERELDETRIEAARRLEQLEVAAAAFMLVAVLSSLLVLVALARETRGPLRGLLRAADTISRGEQVRHVEEAGPEEFRELARAFNVMADEVTRRAAAMSELNRGLEDAVSRRTVELEHAVEALKANDSHRRQLLADVSHELRTPLTIIRGEADVALRGAVKAPAVYRDALERTRSAAEHCARIVDDLLFIARAEVGSANIHPERIDLSDLLSRLVEDAAAIAGPSSARIELHGAPDTCIVHADPVRIRQVLLILIENAIRYGGDRITVRVEPLATGLRVAVTDNGPGMSEADRAHAFDRFFRGSNAAQRYERGTGLGLPVARAIVTAHGGTITLGGDPGEGFSVEFTLPARPVLRAVS